MQPREQNDNRILTDLVTRNADAALQVRTPFSALVVGQGNCTVGAVCGAQ